MTGLKRIHHGISEQFQQHNQTPKPLQRSSCIENLGILDLPHANYLLSLPMIPFSYQGLGYKIKKTYAHIFAVDDSFYHLSLRSITVDFVEFTGKVFRKE